MVIMAFADAAASSVVYMEEIWVHQMTAPFLILEICKKKKNKYITSNFYVQGRYVMTIILTYGICCGRRRGICPVTTCFTTTP
jgi:hypothetical protein